MLYESYVKKVTRWVYKKDAILKYKAPIIITLCVILALVAGFFATKGMPISGLECPSEVVYGSGAPMDVKVLFGKPYYQYAEQGSDVWSTELPSGVGSFKVRVATQRSFGRIGYSDEFAFVIAPAKVTVTAASGKVTYGSVPEASGDLKYEDRIESADFRMSSKVIGSSKVSAIASTVKVVDKNGRDVSSAYVFDTPETTVEIIPRVVTIKLHNAEKEYDGKPLTSKKYDNFDDQLIDGHKGTVTLSGQQIEAGTSDNTVTDFKVLDGKRDVTSNYDYITVGGQLTVKPRNITLTTGSAQRVYNAQNLVSKTCIITKGTLLSNHKLVVKKTTEAFNVGTYNNEAEVKIVEKKNEKSEVTANYKITFDYGKLTVTPKRITVMPKMITKEYDGVPLYTREATVVASELAEGDTIDLTTSANIVGVGSQTNTIVDYKISHGALDVTGNYEVTCIESVLTVTKRSVVVKPMDIEREYDATPLESTLPEITAGSIAMGQKIVLETTGSITTPGTCANHVTSYKIMANGSDVTENYNIIVRSGRLTVTKREVTITAASDSKVYDNTPLINTGYSITHGSIAKGQKLSVSVSGAQTEAGESANKIVSWSITGADGDDVSKYYSVKIEAGVLEIQKRPITVMSADASKMYDGTPLKYNEYFVRQGTLVEGHTVVAMLVGEQTNAGVGANMFEDIFVVNEKYVSVTDNYDITAIAGELTVLPREVSVTYIGSQQVYNGIPLTADSVTVTSGILPLDGHTVVVATGSELVGRYDYKSCTAYIVTEDGSTDMSSNYNIKIEGGNDMIITEFAVMIKPQNAEREYDGTPLTCNTVELIEPKRLPIGHYIELVCSGSVTNVIYSGTDAMPMINVITSYTVRNANGEDVTDSFNVSTQIGTLLVTPRVITLKPRDEVKEYDGTPLMGTTPECSVGSIAEGQTAMILTKGQQIEIGSSENIIESYAIMTESFENVSVNYAITIEKGTLTVTKRKLVIAPADVEKMYDGTPLSAEIAILKEGSLLLGHKFSASVEGSRTDAGVTASTVLSDSVTIMNNELDVSHLYEVVLAEGAVTITPRPITVVFDSLFKIYNGRVFASENFTVTSEIKPLEGHYVSIMSDGADAGIYDSTKYTINVYGGAFDVTANYEVTHDGVITIEKRMVYLDLKPAKKDFDGELLTVEDISATMGTSLVAGHKASAVTDSALPGIYARDAVERGFKIFIYDYQDDFGVDFDTPMDVTVNYDIMLTSDPLLEIIHRGLTLTVADASRIYDETAIFNATEFITAGELAAGHKLIHKNIGGVRVGTYAGLKASDIRVVDAEDNDITEHYQIVFAGQDTFSVEILKRPIIINVCDYTKQYDGSSDFYVPKAVFVDALTPLLDGHRIIFEGSDAGLGTQVINTSGRRIHSDLYGDVTECFDITLSAESFVLTTVRREITIRPATVSRPYNGTPLYGDGKAQVIDGSGLLDGHTVILETTGSQTEIGDGVLTIVSYVIRDAEGNDVTHLYNVSTSDGTVRILRLSLVLATSDASAVYTGNELSARGVSVFIGKLLDGHVIYDAEAEYASVSNVGTYSNTVRGVKVHNAEGQDVTNMYNISYKYGQLTITSE